MKIQHFLLGAILGAFLLFGVQVITGTFDDNDRTGITSEMDKNSSESDLNQTEGDSEVAGDSSQETGDYSKYYESFEDKLNAIVDAVENNYLEDIDKEALYEEAIRGMVAAIGDPYTSYFTKDEYDSFMEKMGGVYDGIGVVVSYAEDERTVIVVAPFKDSPGEKAGIIPGDLVIEVDGVDVVGMPLDKVVELIKGEKGTEVVLTVVRNEETIDIPIKRDTIEIPTIEYALKENNIGYIAMSGFDQVTEIQFKEALVELDKQGQEGLIIDLRNNPGGYLHIVYAIVDELLDKDNMVVYTEDRYGNREELVTVSNNSFEKPLVILINGNSASASEILAGAVKDHKIGVLVGETTFGKGLVQRTFEMVDGSAVKVTISKYYTPNGNYIHSIGIEPDVYVEQDYETEEDEQLDKAIEVIKEMINE